MNTNILQMPFSLTSAATAFLLVSAELFILATRFRVLIPIENRPSFTNIFGTFFHGQFLNNFTISGLGDAYKFKIISSFRESKSLSATQRAVIILMDKGLEITTLLLLFALGCHELNHFTLLSKSSLPKHAVVAITIIGITLLVRHFSNNKQLITKTFTLKNIINGFALSLMAWLLELGAILILCSNFSINSSQGLLILATLSLGSILPSTPAKIGVYEGSMVVGLMQSNIELSSAIKIATTLHAILIFNIIAGVAFIFIKRKLFATEKEIQI